MKDLKVFKDFESDIFFEPVRLNSLVRIHSEDRYRCMIWELSRTLYLTDDNFKKIVLNRRKFSKFQDSLFGKKRITDADRKKLHELSIKDDQGTERWGLPNQFNYFPILCDGFPNEAFLNQDIKERDSWEHNHAIMKFRNPCEEFPMTLVYNPEDFEEVDSRHLLLALLGAKNNEEKLIQDKAITSSRVKLNLNIDPMLSVHQLKDVLSENIEQIYAKVQDLKKDLEEKGIKFSDTSKLPKRRLTRTFQVTLSYLGYYRLLECEKWGWDDVDALFDERFKSTPLSKVVIKSIEHYKRNVTKFLPDLKHSRVL